MKKDMINDFIRLLRANFKTSVKQGHLLRIADAMLARGSKKENVNTIVNQWFLTCVQLISRGSVDQNQRFSKDLAKHCVCEIYFIFIITKDSVKVHMKVPGLSI